MTAATSGTVTPAIRNTLVRERAPLTRVTREAGTPTARARARRASSVARPSTGDAATRMRRGSCEASTPGRDRGRTRTVINTPSPTCRICIRPRHPVSHSRGPDFKEDPRQPSPFRRCRAIPTRRMCHPEDRLARGSAPRIVFRRTGPRPIGPAVVGGSPRRSVPAWGPGPQRERGGLAPTQVEALPVIAMPYWSERGRP
jgi:hypothetical protein